ncbi:hypothetical protein LKL35_03565 [Streptomyces sp. ET3-23]|uniref:hypothetical protein n=1 Tax=Streptomyces sp. ET3-23 TaxID=2885643 RepID=UPI001D1280AB|nr:hypothetical protein [Streptomyces sp. ET3-23]MCC2274518.1 hypothetical protein [Streptomyces sp. ET3-23]
MQKVIVRQSDTITLMPALTPPATLVPPPPIPIPRGTAGFQVEGLPACVPDDIETMEIPPVPYSTPAFPTSGTLRARFRVPAANRAKYARTGHATVEVVVNGGPLEVRFTVLTPASNPAGSPDPVTEYQGSATLTCPRTRPVTAG